MAEDVEVTGNEEGLTKVQKLWKEVKEWKSNWKWSTFLNALVLGLAASLFDSVTDFNFAWSVPEDCGLFYFKNVERMTYTHVDRPPRILSRVRRPPQPCLGTNREVLGRKS